MLKNPAPRFAVLPYFVLLGGVLIAATSSILIRGAQAAGMPSLHIAAGRLGLAALILLPIGFARVRHEVANISRRNLLLAAVSGLFLGAHFAAWITSLQYTSVASSVALVTTNPIWVGLASLFILHERLPRLMLAGMALTVLGSILIGVSDSQGTAASNAMLGNGLALLGAIAGSVYFLIGRVLRAHMSILAYIWLVYSTAAIVLLFVAGSMWFASGAVAPAPFSGYQASTYVFILLLAIGPQLLGHTSFNWALRYLSATFVAVSILGEPIGSALLALWLFNERFAALQLLGFALLLTGIVLAARAERVAE